MIFIHFPDQTILHETSETDCCLVIIDPSDSGAVSAIVDFGLQFHGVFEISTPVEIQTIPHPHEIPFRILPQRQVGNFIFI